MLILLPPSETKRAGRRRRNPARLRGAELSRADQAAARRRRRRAPAVAQPRRRDRRAAARRHPGRRGRAQPRHPDLAGDARDRPLRRRALRGSGCREPDRRSARVRGSARRDRVGRVRADDAPSTRFPAYRLSHDSRLPGVALGRLWRAPVSRPCSPATAGLLLDLRSEAYAALGPLPRARRCGVRPGGQRGRGRASPRAQPFQQEGQGRVRARAAARRASITPMSTSLLAWARRRPDPARAWRRGRTRSRSLRPSARGSAMPAHASSRRRGRRPCPPTA